MNNTEKRYLFCCETGYQLFNAINLRISVANDAPADVILAEQTDFSQILDNLKNANIFDHVVRPNSREYSELFWAADLETQILWYQNPSKLIPTFPTKYVYSDFFIPIDHIYWQLLYYHQLNRGIKARIHFFEEGLRAYTMDFITTEKNRKFVLDHYRDHSFANSIVDFYLYEPELYSNDNFEGELKNLPKIHSRESAIAKSILKVFPVPELPKEKFIFFEESYIGDKRLANDFELFEQIVSVVGRDNIIVKRHPRNKIDRFSMRGYKVMDNWTTPWEASLLNNDVKDHIFVTVSSTASLTPMLLFDEDVKSIHLLNIFKGDSPLLADPGFKACYLKTLELCNRQTINVYKPFTIEEALEIVHYLNITNGKD